VIITGTIGGLVGGLLILQFDDDPEVFSVISPAPTTTVSPEVAARESHKAIAAVVPTVVTIVTESAPITKSEEGSFVRQNFGSGIVVSSDGHILTNFHVVDGAETITVVLQSGERRSAKLLADDAPFTDLAILMTDTSGLMQASFGDSNLLELGEPLAAISSGLITFENQVKMGVFSARQDAFPRDGVLLLDMLQTDAAVNHGDSGGALVNLRGEVVGLLTTVIRESEGRRIDGVTLAHSSNSFRPFVEAVTATGVNPRPRIGIERLWSQHIPLTPESMPEIQTEIGMLDELTVSSGALIVQVAPDSPAERAGILQGDVVVGVDGIAVDLESPFVNLVAIAGIPSELELFVVRGKEQLVISVFPQLVVPS
tara:strand:- start:1531 stop:2640 length:1110 start_codon:yes stop_codon:yes gene_type:complete